VGFLGQALPKTTGQDHGYSTGSCRRGGSIVEAGFVGAGRPPRW
jgi:hypothetical protein